MGGNEGRGHEGHEEEVREQGCQGPLRLIIIEDLDHGSPEGKEGARPEGLRCHQEGHPSVQEGQGAPQKLSYWCVLEAWWIVKAQLWVWGFPHPLSAGACHFQL